LLDGASDHAILRDKTHVPTKKSLLVLSSQDALLAQNKLLAKQLESLIETLSKLPTQLQAAQPSHLAVMQVGRCSIYGGAHESGRCIPLDDAAKEVNYIGNQNRQGFHAGGFSGYQQGANFNQNQGKDGGHIQGISSINTKEDHPTNLRIKGLACMRGPLSWKRLWLSSCKFQCLTIRALSQLSRTWRFKWDS